MDGTRTNRPDLSSDALARIYLIVRYLQNQATRSKGATHDDDSKVPEYMKKIKPRLVADLEISSNTATLT